MSTFWSFYDPDTGLFTGRVFSGPKRALEANTPPGRAAIEGRFDHRSQRVDLATGEVVAYEPPADARQTRDLAHARIVALEKRSQRPLRELFLDPSNAEARQRVEAIDAEIETLRAELSG